MQMVPRTCLNHFRLANLSTYKLTTEGRKDTTGGHADSSFYLNCSISNNLITLSYKSCIQFKVKHTHTHTSILYQTAQSLPLHPRTHTLECHDVKNLRASTTRPLSRTRTPPPLMSACVFCVCMDCFFASVLLGCFNIETFMPERRQSYLTPCTHKYCCWN